VFAESLIAFSLTLSHMTRYLTLVTTALLLALTHVRGIDTSAWTQPFPPFKIAGNLYYVGSKDLASYLITTPEGDILINSSLEASVPLIGASLEKLGHHWSDVKILLISHAHWDHCAGSAAVKKLSGAQYMVMEQDVKAVESGGSWRPRLGRDSMPQYPPLKVDRVLKDGDQVTLGGAVLTAHLTPGHTAGCTTWTMDVREGERDLHAVIIGSPNVNEGYQLVNNKDYPNIATDYQTTFRVLKALPVDLFLGAHGMYFDMTSKYDRRQKGEKDVFIDPAGYSRYVADREQAFVTEWEKQKAAVPVSKKP